VKPPRSVFPAEHIGVLIESAGDNAVTISVRPRGAAKVVAIRTLRARPAQPAEPPVRPPTSRQARTLAKLLGDAALDPVSLWVDDALVEYAWERYLLGLGIAGPAVRVGLAPARASRLPLLAPLYWCHVGRSQEGIDRDLRAFEEFAAIVTGRVSEIAETVSLGWPRLDLVTLSVTQEIAGKLSRPSFRRDANAQYSVGWFERLLHRHQVRALVLMPENLLALEPSLALAHDLVGRGGPAIGVRHAGQAVSLSGRSVAAELLTGAAIEEVATFTPGWAWWGGPGRERPLAQPQVTSELVDRLVETVEPAGYESKSVMARGESLGRILTMPSTIEFRGAMYTRFELAARLAPEPGRLWAGLTLGRARPFTGSAIAFGLSRSPVDLITWRMAEVLAMARKVDPEPVTLTAAILGERTGGRARSRFVNLRLDRLDPPVGQPLSVGAVSTLDISIGPRNVFTATGADPLDEIIVWRPDEEGVWLDLAVTGLDFDLLGEPLQQVWLPRRGVTGPIAFRVVPLHPGASAIRIQVYGRGRLLQSYKMAAIADGPEPIDPGEWTARLAGVLGPAVPDERDEFGQRALEPADPGPWQRAVRELDLLDDWDRTEHPAAAPRVCISVNEHRDESVVSVRLGERYEVKRDLPTTHGDTIRCNLDAMMGETQAASFGFTDESATGNALKLDMLRVLARAGNALFIAAFSKEVGDELARLPDETIIEVGHLVAAKAIPWNVVYDRTLATGTGEPATLCPVGFKAVGDGHACGALEGCLADGADGKAGVLCPRGFWGFRRRVELPLGVARPRVGPPDPAAPQSIAVLVDADVVGTDNLDEILKLARNAGGGIRLEVPTPPVKPGLFTALRDPHLTSAYLACHAFPSVGVNGERLSFDGPSAKADDPVVERTNLIVNDLDDIRWLLRPLVVLNACGTAAYRGGSIPTFLSTLITRCGAGGVVATEISVLNQLAAKFGADLMRAYLDGEPVGQAVLLARRKLARYQNPLGLAWTVYSDSEQVREVTPDG
jgi:hypothetical protein